MSAITTHVLDAVLGKPAAGIAVHLAMRGPEGWAAVGDGVTDADGRCRNLCADGSRGTYRLTFDVEAYWLRSGRSGLYPEIAVAFHVDGEQHYHIPLLLSDNSYTTYRGS